MGILITRLEGIALPPFSRISWVSSEARDAWAPGLSELKAQWAELVIHVALEGPAPVLPVAARPDTSHKLRATAARRGLALVPLPPTAPAGILAWQSPPLVSSNRVPQQFLIGRTEAVSETLDAIRTGDLTGAASTLGVPPCCASFEQHSLPGWQDPWWPVAVATAGQPGAGAQTGPYELELSAGCSRILLLTALQLPAPWYVPCSLVCPAAAACADHLHEVVGRCLGPAAVETLEALAGWPLQWSGLHGIAEIKTPVFKLIQPADPTAEALTVRILGRGPVEASAKGVRFPFVQRRRRHELAAPASG